ncbi:elongation factor ts protein [Cystoisospora suis]|uniref:Elongation factor ts protein n=1 Tax=Cystoisospora suis TaxID=483139 RepID=A0A2C6L6E3_9APIC|nr:elongation factor ts protein [Cystoisospora suis]
MTTTLLRSYLFSSPRFFSSAYPCPPRSLTSFSFFTVRSRRSQRTTHRCTSASQPKQIFPFSSFSCYFAVRASVASSSLSSCQPSSFSLSSSSSFSSPPVLKTRSAELYAHSPLHSLLSSAPTAVRCYTASASPVSRLAQDSTSSSSLEDNESSGDSYASTASARGAEKDLPVNIGVSSSCSHSSPSKVKLLRSRTGGVSIGECRKALEASNWDIESAVVYLRKRGIARGNTRSADRVPGEGLISITTLATENTLVTSLVEVNSDTDFVSRHPRFVAFAQLAGRALAQLLLAPGRVGTTPTSGESSLSSSFSFSSSSLGSEDRRGGGRGPEEERQKQERKKEENAGLLELLKNTPISPDDVEESGLDADGLSIGKTSSPKHEIDAGDTVGPGVRSSDERETPSPSSVCRNNSTGSEDSVTLSRPTILLREILSLLSQQFGETIEISRCRGLTVPVRPMTGPGSLAFENHREDSSYPSCYAVGSYIHNHFSGKNVGRSGAVVVLRWRMPKKSFSTDAEDKRGSSTLAGNSADTNVHMKMQLLAKLLAMQCIATRPRFLRYSDIDPNFLETEKQIIRDSLLSKGERGMLLTAHRDVLEKAVEGRLSSTLNEQILLEQDFLLSAQLQQQLLSSSNKRSEDSLEDRQNSKGYSDAKVKSTRTGNLCEGKNVDSGGTTMPMNLKVKDALKYVASHYDCEDLDVSDLELLSIDDCTK